LKAGDSGLLFFKEINMDEFVKVGVAALIKKDDQVLLLKRNGNHGLGTWSVPGGHLDLFETPETCAERETLEETGVTVKATKFLGITNDVFKETNKHYITLWMECEYVSGIPEITSPEEAEVVAWCSCKKLPENLFSPFQNFLNQGLYITGNI
jgi:8-oxo-dGTP diphosphatase